MSLAILFQGKLWGTSSKEVTLQTSQVKPLVNTCSCSALLCTIAMYQTCLPSPELLRAETRELAKLVNACTSVLARCSLTFIDLESNKKGDSCCLDVKLRYSEVCRVTHFDLLTSWRRKFTCCTHGKRYEVQVVAHLWSTVLPNRVNIACSEWSSLMVCSV